MEKASSGYIVRSEINPKAILCTDGEFHGESTVGPGGHCAKVYKMKERAKKQHPGRLVVAI